MPGLVFIAIGIGLTALLATSKTKYFIKKVKKMSSDELLMNMVLFLGIYIVSFSALSLFLNTYTSILFSQYFIIYAISALLVLFYYFALIYYAI
ncbi:MAG: hypothetical protein QW478_03100 [Candidatus Micrarchaeaceae archaeon]